MQKCRPVCRIMQFRPPPGAILRYGCLGSPKDYLLPQPGGVVSSWPDTGKDTDAPVSVFSDAAEDADVPVSLFSDAAEDADVPVLLFSDAAEDGDAPVSLFSDAAEDADAPVSLFSGFCEDEDTPVLPSSAPKISFTKHIRSSASCLRSCFCSSVEPPYAPEEYISSSDSRSDPCS